MAVRLDRDRAVEVRTMHLESPPGGQRRERGRRGMAVVVALPDGDQRDTRSHGPEELFEARVGRAVMRDLEDLGLRRSQRQGDVRLRIGGQQRVDLAVPRVDHGRRVVRVVARGDRLPGPEHAQLEPAEAKCAPGVGGDDDDVLSACGSEGSFLVGARRRNPRIEDHVDTQPVEDARGPADVVALRVREDDCGQPADAQAAQLAGDVRLRPALVDEDVSLGHLEQGRVSLPDVEGGDPQAVRRRRRWRMRPERPNRRNGRHGEHTEDGDARRAHAATYAASQPFAHAIASARCGKTGSTAVHASAVPSSGATAGQARALAGTEYTGTEPNWSHRIGAVAKPQPADTASTSASFVGTGYPSRRRPSAGTATKMAATAENDSWKPGS